MQNELKAIQNSNGGGLSYAVTNKYTSVRHELSRLDKNKKTAGEVAKLINKELKIKTTAKELIEVYTKLKGKSPEWHHAGFFKKAMGKTYFFNLKEIELLKDYMLNFYVPKLTKKEKELIESEKMKFIKKYNGIEFKRVSRKKLSKYSVVEKKEMLGKYGYFNYNNSYNCEVYYSGVTFKSEKTKQKFINTYLKYKKEK